ncbi:glycosyltransferase [Methylobacterium sp. J-077]|uniref:glycosyltransferase n=1 Tax=Methylobacterium sp. J-077 TaxID=2836656 RepID=UPI001FBBAF94|nr:glycosyltransferase [Methylobacterium sp. J-077]MCJ2121687.1 glycosyltransferase [Methylobacterium sp. J-077]
MALATYNGSGYLQRQLTSLAEQTLPPFELVVFDDGSDDDTHRIVAAFAAKAPFPVRHQVNAERLGYADNFLAAAQACFGTYIAFCDQDDVWHPQKLERCVGVLKQEQAVLCTHTAGLIDGDGIAIGSLSQNITETRVWSARKLPPWDVFLGFTQVFDRRLLDLVAPARRGYDNHARGSMLAHDRWIYVLGTNLGRTVTLAEPLAHYRQHGANLYGGRRKSLMTRLRGKLVGSAEALRTYASIAAHRAEIFLDVAERQPDDVFAPEARIASEWWAEIAATFLKRAELYEHPEFTGRIGRMCALLAERLYRPVTRGGLGLNVLFKDIILGVFGLRFSPPMSSKLGSS